MTDRPDGTRIGTTTHGDECALCVWGGAGAGDEEMKASIDGIRINHPPNNTASASVFARLARAD